MPTALYGCSSAWLNAAQLNSETAPMNTETKYTPTVGPTGELTKAPAGETTFRLKKILVPVDFSGSSKKALEHACAFCRQFAAELVLVHVFEPYPPIPQMDPVDLDLVQEAKRRLAAIRLSLDAPLSCQAILRISEAHSEIVRAAKDIGADLVILSTDGASRLVHALLGSTMERVVRRAACPILIVQEREHESLDRVQNDEGTRSHQPSPEALCHALPP